MTAPVKAPLVFILGAPRSGTSWVQQLLGAHPDIATPQETHLARSFMGPLVNRWEQQVQLLARTASESSARHPSRRIVGLPTILSEADIDGLLAGMVEMVRARTLERKPGADVVVEKSPDNSLSVPVLFRACPQAKFVHILRNPRDVIASYRSAAQGWGNEWAHSSLLRAARVWREHVEGALQARTLTTRYMEVRYEDLRRDGANVLAGLFRFCGVRSDPEQCSRLCEEYALERQRREGSTSFVLGGEALGLFGEGTVGEPDGFYGGQDRRPLPPRHARRLERLVGDLATDLGYGGSHPGGESTIQQVVGVGTEAFWRLLNDVTVVYEMAQKGQQIIRRNRSSS